MQRLWVGLLFAAGCGLPGPREETVLFDSPEERARRDLLVFYYSEADDGTVISMTVPRRGPAEARGELGPQIRRFPAFFPSRFPPRWRTEDISYSRSESVKNAASALPTVETTSARSRYWLKRSQEVSAMSKHP